MQDGDVPRVYEPAPGISTRQLYKVVVVASGMEVDLGIHTVAAAAKKLGIPEAEYKADMHWPIIYSRAIGAIADALLAEDEEFAKKNK